MRVLLLVLSLVSATASAQVPVVLALAVPAADTTATGGLPAPEAAAPVVAEAFRSALPARADSSGRSHNTVTLGIAPIGLRVAYARRVVRDVGWSFPIAVEVSSLLVGDGDGGLGLVSAVGGAIQAARRMGTSSVYLQPGFQLSAGQEIGYSAYDDGQRFFVGGRLGLELMRYPERAGFVGGVGLYETRRFGSHVYNELDLSVAILLGAQF